MGRSALSSESSLTRQGRVMAKSRYYSAEILSATCLLLCLSLLSGPIFGQADTNPEIEKIRKTLRDTNDGRILSLAIQRVIELGPEAKAATPELVDLLLLAPRHSSADFDDPLPAEIDTALRKIGPAATAELLERMKVKASDPKGRYRLAAVLSVVVSYKDRAQVPVLLELLRNEQDPAVLPLLARAVAEIQPEGNKANETIQVLVNLLKHPDIDAAREAAVGVKHVGLNSKDGVPAKNALPELVRVLGDPDNPAYPHGRNLAFRVAATEAIREICLALQKADEISALPILKESYNSLKAAQSRELVAQDGLETIETAVKYLELVETQRRPSSRSRTGQWVIKRPLITLGLSIHPVLLFLCLILLWIRPLWLLQINEGISDSTKFRLPAWLGSIELDFRHAILVGFFHHNRRVLDAWVARYVFKAGKIFAERSTVSEREVHVLVPVMLDKNNISELKPGDLNATFARNMACLLIWGEGGAGKTSLACLLGKWAMATEKKKRLCQSHLMLPVLIERDLETQSADNISSLLKVVQDQLRIVTDEEDPPAVDLVRHLLKRRRVLLIVDSLSEMADSSRATITDAIAGIPVNACIVTSRTDEPLQNLRKSNLTPLRINGANLSRFMNNYLEWRKRRDLFDDEEFFDTCRRLSAIVGDREVTALLAKLYAEQLIRAKAGLSGEDDPNNIPELMLAYLNDINRAASAKQPDTASLHKAAEGIAWECLKKTFRPMPANQSDVLRSLGGGKEVRLAVEHLENKLKIIRRVGLSRDRLTFTLDPLCEYLAGLHLVNAYGNNEDLWHNFLERAAEQLSVSQSVKEFLLAIRECCLSVAEERVPPFVPDQLAKLAGLDLEELKKALAKRKLRLIVQKLRFPEPEYAASAAEELGTLLNEAKTVLPILVTFLQHKNDPLVYEKIIDSIGNFGPQAAEAVPILIDLLTSKEPMLCRHAAEALGHIGPQSAAGVPSLKRLLGNPDEDICKSATYALGCLGPAATAAFADIAGLLKSQDQYVRGVARVALTQIGATKSNLDTLIALLENQDKEIQIVAADLVETLGAEGEQAVPALIGLLNSVDPDARKSAIGALMRIGPEAISEAELPALIKLLDVEEPLKVRRAAVYAVAKIGPKAEGAVQMLTKLLKDPEDYVRMGACFALGNIGAASMVAVSELTTLLGDPDETVRKEAHDALRKIGSDPEHAAAK